MARTERKGRGEERGEDSQPDTRRVCPCQVESRGPRGPARTRPQTSAARIAEPSKYAGRVWRQTQRLR
eukprot:2572443-Lingulodinium_polyedra.AAC.1